MSIACRLEDSERVVVLPRCMVGSRCSIGPLGLSYRGRQVRGYFCDAQMLPPSSEAADTWTTSGRSRLDRHSEQEPRRSSDPPTGNGGKSENDNDNGKEWMQDSKEHGKDHGNDHGNEHGKDHGKDHGNDHDENKSKDGGSHEGDDSNDHVHYGPQDTDGERHTTTTDAMDDGTTVTNETPTEESTFDQKRVPGTTA